ncbi:ComF family protein [uncultured Modestobacter sp.]|uniref:ComF family protein n=1 Tax=uncultured Modestobacter sp. TaxID=380048 RepID=UPI002628B13B|nr:phosphoribosyltransferase family protein [uncultured Modestobacter sp.]
MPVALCTLGARVLADLVLPQDCAGCAVPGALLCPACRARLARPRLAEPRRHPPGFPPTVAAGAYAGPVRPAVLAFKERGRAELAGPLGTALALAVVAVLTGLPPAPPGRPGSAGPLVLVPSSAAAVRSRGRDHVRELARSAVVELRRAGVPAVTLPVLGRAGRTRDSAGLDAAQRRANLAGRFRARPVVLPPGSRLVLVDDVVSSGATLTEAARALAALDRGGEDTPVLGAVVAATPRRVRRPAVPPPPGAFTVRC